MLPKESLERYYLIEKKSSKEISLLFKCSENKVNYWMDKYTIKKRSIADSMYVKCNPLGDPFSVNKSFRMNQNFIYGLGLGLFWGEGNKKNKNSVRLGNTDPDLIRLFIIYLRSVYNIDVEKLNFSIQIFEDLDVDTVRNFWIEKLNIKPIQIYRKITISKSGKKGSYKNKNKYGVVTVYFNNTKLKQILDKEIEDIKKMY